MCSQFLQVLFYTLTSASLVPSCVILFKCVLSRNCLTEKFRSNAACPTCKLPSWASDMVKNRTLVMKYELYFLPILQCVIIYTIQADVVSAFNTFDRALMHYRTLCKFEAYRFILPPSFPLDTANVPCVYCFL